MTNRLTEIKARVARYKEELSGMRRCNDSFWVSDLEYALAEIERLHDISAFNGLTEQVKALSAERDRLRGQLSEAIEDIESWAGYASQYFQDKHDLQGCLARHRAALEDKS